MCTINVLFDEDFVVEEEANTDDGEDDVDLGAKRAGLFEDGLVGGDGFVLFQSGLLAAAQNA